MTAGEVRVTVDESERQAILLSLALTTLLRPGWLAFHREIAEKFQGRTMFEQFRDLNVDQVKPT